MSLSGRLRETQHDSENPVLFEEALTEAFRQLGAQTVHKGGANEPDVFLEISGRRIVVDAKTVKTVGRGEVIGEARINFDALERYKERYDADRAAVVAFGFRSGAVRDTAEKRGVNLIETEAVCKALENHMFYPYNPQHVYRMMFEGGTVITPDDINPSTRDVSRQIEMIKRVLADLNRLQKSERRFNLNEAIIAYRWRDPSIKKEEIEDALTFLSSPPFNIVKQDDDAYSLTLDFDDMQKRFSVLYDSVRVLGVPPIKSEYPPTPPEGIKVFFNYKGSRYEAIFISPGKIVYEGKEYSPSAASRGITGTSRNGWRDWKFIDKEGKEQSIEVLRHRTLGRKTGS